MLPFSTPAQSVPGAVAPMLPDDPAVVALVDRVVATRDPAAFGELYDMFLERVYRYLFFRAGSQLEAEDLTEQVFLRAWASIDRFQWRGKPFRAWLYTLAHNALVDHRRRTRPVASLDNPEHPIDCPSDPAAQALVQWMDTELLARAVSQLTPEQQQVIVLRFVEGQDTAEIASMMGKREGTIRALQFRALHSLRRILGPQDEGPHDHD